MPLAALKGGRDRKAPRCGRRAPGWRAGAAVAAGVLLAGCARRAPHGIRGPAEILGGPAVQQVAFSADARVTAGGETRRLRLKVFAQAPDRMRIEGSGVIGGIAVVATTRDGRMRIVVPSRRAYAEGSARDDLGTRLVGFSFNACDLGRVVSRASGLASFDPCAAPAPHLEERGNAETAETALEPDPPPAREDESAVVLQFVPSEDPKDPLAREVRLEAVADPASRAVLTHLRRLPFPAAASTDGGFYWEPPPPGALRTEAEHLGDTEAP